MKIKILIFSSAFYLWACNKPIETEYTQNGIKLYEYWKGDSSTFLIKEFRSDGSLKADFEFSKLRKNGQQKNYTPEGKLNLITSWRDGKQNVNVQRFNTDGNILPDTTQVIYRVKPDIIFAGGNIEIQVELADKTKKIVGAFTGSPEGEYIINDQNSIPVLNNKVVNLEIKHSKEGEKKLSITLITPLEEGIVQFHPIIITYKVNKR